MSDSPEQDREKQELQSAFITDRSRSKLGGRPRLYDTPEEFDARVDEYYQHCKATDEPILWTGLALFMGFSGRAAIDEYLQYEGFSNSVKRAKGMVEYAYEKRLSTGTNAAAPIFALKNFGWKDTQTLNHGGRVGIVAAGVEVDPKDPIEASRLYQQLMQTDE